MPKFDNYSVLIQSHFDSTDVSRMLEDSFDKSVFTGQSSDYIPGLFKFKDATGSSDVWKIKDKAELTPEPLKTILNNVNTGLYCERPAYIPVCENAYIYPLGDDELYRIKSDAYLGTTSIPMDRSDLINYRESLSKYNSEYKKGSSYTTDFSVFYIGSSSNSSKINNLLKFNEGESSWESNWSNATITLGDSETFFADDLIEIAKKNNNTITFNTDTTSLGAGTYCLSFFARVNDTLYRDTANTIEEVDYRKSDPIKTGINGTGVGFDGSECKSWIYIESSTIKSGLIDTIHEGIEYSADDLCFYIDSMWRRISLIFKVDSDIDSLNFKINWPDNGKSYTLANSNRINPIKICGLLLEKQSYPSAYDKRYVKYDDTYSTDKYHPVAIYFGNKVDLSNSSWTINYRRYLEVSPLTNSGVFDTLGKINIGYVGNRAVLVVNNQTVDELTLSNIDKIYNHIESVFITLNNDTSLLKVKVYCENIIYNDQNYYELSATITDKSVFNSLTISDEEYKYHLLLGGTSPMDLTPGYYSNVIFLPELISDLDESKMINSLFGESISSGRYRRDKIFDPTDSSIEITWDDFKAITSAEEFDSYKLTTDSTDEGLNYKAGDILICVIPFENRTLPVKSIPSYWNYTAFELINNPIENTSVFRAATLIEGFEKINERKGN